MEIEKELLKDLIINDKQGYAFYLKTPNLEIEKYNGLENLNIETRKINSFSQFRLASIIKQFIAYLIIVLVKKRKINLETKLENIFHNLPEYMREITILNLLNHTSGIPDFEEMIYKDQVTDELAFKYLKNRKTGYFKPGTEYRYSNSGYIVLRLVIEKISGQNISEFINQNIFKPLSMKYSCINFQGKTIIKNRVYGTYLTKNKFKIKDQGRDTATIGDGGIYSNINDLKLWLNFIEKEVENNRYFYNKSIKTNRMTKYSCGLEFEKCKNYRIINHCGETIGTNTVIGFIPKKKIHFIFLTNLNDVDTYKLVKNLTNLINKSFV